MKHLIRAVRDRLHSPDQATDLDSHICDAVGWICRAHDASNDDGVPHSFDLKQGKWLPSYPETTGYIIPTLLDLARLRGRADLADRAIRMARWERAIQFPEGGIQAGMIDATPRVPTIFNTGQVLFGFVRAWEHTKAPEFRDAAIKASNWLVDAMDDDGSWTRYKSPFTSTPVATYNTRTAFALARSAATFGRPDFLAAAVRNAEWALTRGTDDFWLSGNNLELFTDDRALTHTIAYAIRGILEIGLAASRSDLVDFAIGFAGKIAAVQRPDGALPGLISPHYEALSAWTCVTGNSQMALNWQRIAHAAGHATYLDNARRANRFNMSVQRISTGRPESEGALPGSFPIDGDYMKWRFPNWATKFFIDALLLERYGADAGNAGA